MSVQLDIEAVGVVPVIVMDDPVRAADTATALSAGGIGCAEITLRTLDALAAIEEIAARYPDFVIGAGTVITEIQVDAAVDAGASFIVSPGLDEGVIRRARERSVPVVPGVATATEIQRAIGLGLDRLKFFPAGSLGGVGAIRAFGGPFP